MDNKELLKKMRTLNSMLADYLDRMELDEADEESGKEESGKKDSAKKEAKKEAK